MARFLLTLASVLFMYMGKLNPYSFQLEICSSNRLVCKCSVLINQSVICLMLSKSCMESIYFSSFQIFFRQQGFFVGIFVFNFNESNIWNLNLFPKYAEVIHDLIALYRKHSVDFSYVQHQLLFQLL